MAKKIFILFLTIFVFLGAVNSVFAQRGTASGNVIQIRFASPLPRNSDWGRALDRLAAEWMRITNNAVRVSVIHDGLQGGESQMLSALSSNDIQVALLTSAGISEICSPIMTLSIPFLIRNDAEFDVVLNEVIPFLDSRVNNDFVVIAWSKAGWVYVFSQNPVFTPDDLRRQNMATNEEYKDINQAFRLMGFRLVETELTSLAQRLATGMINAIYFLPAAVAPMQLHRHLGNMLDVPIAPFMGAIVMNRVTWNRISPAHQQEMIRVTQRISAEFDVSMPRAEANAIASMRGSGLRINKPTPEQENMWRTELDNTMPALVGPVFDRDLYQQITNVLQRTRSSGGSRQ